MNKILGGGIALVVIIIIALGIVAYAIFRPPEEASAPIEAIPLNVETDESAAAETMEEGVAEVEIEPVVEEPVTEAEAQAEVAVEEIAAAEEAETNVVEESAVVETETTAKEEVAAGASAEEMDAAEAETEAVTVVEETAEEAMEAMEEVVEVSPVLFEIVQGETEARFLIDEVLRGDPITVVGATNQAAGQFAVNPADLSETQVGVIQVNARALATDNSFRNRAIKNWILLTDAHEFVTFAPTEIVGLPQQATVGETYRFQIIGDLTITDVTRQVTFNVTATPISESRIESTASTSFPYIDFELAIPDSPSVDTVADEVRLEIDFVAEAISPTS